jgi:hypothetical protein
MFKYNSRPFLSLEGRVMSHAVSHRPLTKGPGSIPYQSMRDLCRTKWHLNTLFSQHFAPPPPHYHSTGAPYKPLFACYFGNLGALVKTCVIIVLRSSES